MDRKKMLFIYNPYAGKAKIRNYLFEIIDIFTKAGYEVTAYPTQKQGDATEIVKSRSNEFELVVCSGGDGTLDEVVTGMMQRTERIPIGFIPAGSTNDFAKSLGIPNNMKKAAQAIVNGVYFPCDIGSFNEVSFIYIAAFGLFTDVSYETDQDVKNMLGHLAYVLEGTKRISSIPAYHLSFMLDGVACEGDFMFGMITNSLSVGGFRNITGKHVHLDDGVFEVTLIKRPSTMIEFNLILRALVGRDINSECMYCFKTDQIKIEATEEIPWTLDGEFGGNHKKVVIKNEKQALNIILKQER